MTVKLTPRERLVLLALMSVDGEVSNPALRQVAGIGVEADARRRLNELKYVASERRGSAYWHELTDDGWAWCRAELSAERPERADAGSRVLYALLHRVDHYLHAADLRPADVFGVPAPDDEPGPDDELAPDEPQIQGADADALGVDDDGPGAAAHRPLDARVRAAYTALASEAGDWVLLSGVRAVLADVDRAELDALLVRLERTPDVHLVPAADPTALSEVDLEAGVRVGGRSKHLIRVDRP